MRFRLLPFSLFLLPFLPLLARAADPQQFVTYEGKDGPGKGKHIVLIAGDEEYRSEESMPMLGRLLAERHGFTCTVLFSVDPKTGEISPKTANNTPGTPRQPWLHSIVGRRRALIRSHGNSIGSGYALSASVP